MHAVKKAKYIEEYRILLIFEDKSKKIVDFEKILNGFNGPIFKPLRDLSYFRNFEINLDTITWPNGADVSPDYLYDIGQDL